ncbi:MAG TPA: hypothetical protein GXX28_09630 [Firmicutes bacterium]|nr:hypothetical protein [Bacillota bacterium]
MRKSQRAMRWLVLATLGLLLLGFMVSGQACPGPGTKPQPTRLTRPAPRRVATPAPVRPAPTAPAGSLSEAISRTKAEVDRRNWSGAEREAANLGTAWRPVRGQKTWSAADIAAFEKAYAQLRTAIKAKNQTSADRALGEMSRIAHRNGAVRPAPTRTVPVRQVPVRRTMPGPPRR